MCYTLEIFNEVLIVKCILIFACMRLYAVRVWIWNSLPTYTPLLMVPEIIFKISKFAFIYSKLFCKRLLGCVYNNMNGKSSGAVNILPQVKVEVKVEAWVRISVGTRVDVIDGIYRATDSYVSSNSMSFSRIFRHSCKLTWASNAKPWPSSTQPGRQCCRCAIVLTRGHEMLRAFWQTKWL